MSTHTLVAQLLDDDTELTLVELCHATHAGEEQVRLWVLEGVLSPRGVMLVAAPDEVAAFEAEADQMHMARINGFNARTNQPTAWQSEVYTGADYLDKMLKDKAGNVVVLAGNNARKTEYILKSVQAGYNVLSDKPMAITPKVLVSKTRRTCSMGVASKAPTTPIPALFTSTSIGPAAATAAAMLAASVTSSGTSRTRSAGSSPARGLRMVAMTFQPCAWKWRAVSSP